MNTEKWVRLIDDYADSKHCKCETCGAVFEFSEAVEIESEAFETVYTCPDCGAEIEPRRLSLKDLTIDYNAGLVFGEFIMDIDESTIVKLNSDGLFFLNRDENRIIYREPYEKTKEAFKKLVGDEK